MRTTTSPGVVSGTCTSSYRLRGAIDPCTLAGDVLALKNGEKVVYLALATHKDLLPTFIVCSKAQTDPKEVAFRDVVSLVRPLDSVDTAWVKPVLLGYVHAVRDAHIQCLAV